jgi:U4/U6 small nuclear ribonucleoprotein PRP4
MQPKKSGTFVVSAGFDKAVNIFSADDWALCKSLTGHDGTVLAADVTDDARFIASCGRDRTVKLWARDDMQGI